MVNRTAQTSGSCAADLQLLTAEEMGRADRMAVAGGRAEPDADGERRAAPSPRQRIAMCVPARRASPCSAGPATTAATALSPRATCTGRASTCAWRCSGPPGALKGDAAAMAQRCGLPITALTPSSIDGAQLIVDALFGAGLARPIAGVAAEVVAAINRSRVPVLAVDVPSGLDGTTGEAAGPVVKAVRTVTFFRRKPGHLLLPGRLLCGEINVADIGIPDAVLADIGANTWANAPGLWSAQFPWPKLDGHKYGRGHALVVSGPAAHTGAARLGARGALRVGAGLVTVASPPDAVAVNAAHLTAIMLQPFDGPEDLARILADKRKNAVLLGPALGVGAATQQLVHTVLSTGAATVLDADAITSFAGSPSELFVAIAGMRAPRRPHAARGRVPAAVRGCGDGLEAAARPRRRAAVGRRRGPQGGRHGDRRSRRPRRRSMTMPHPGWRRRARATCWAASSPACLRNRCRPSRPRAPACGCTAPPPRPSVPASSPRICPRRFLKSCGPWRRWAWRNDWVPQSAANALC